MKMKFNKSQLIGLVALIVLISVLQFIIIKVDFSIFYNKSKTPEQFLLTAYYNNKIDSLKRISVLKSNIKSYFKFNPNRLSYKSWAYLGLNTYQLYLLDSFRSEKKFITSIQVKNILKINDSLYNLIDSLMYFSKEHSNYMKARSEKKINFKTFNPNAFLLEDWKNYGFSTKQSQVLVNYGIKKGGYKSKEELKNVFVVSEEKFNKMEEFILLPDRVVVDKQQILNLNTANSDELKRINGIGDVYSKIIVEYREKLGGFVYYNQLKEIRGLDSTAISDIRRTFELDKEFQVRKVNINKATLDEIQNHPYINIKLAKEIVYFRTNFRSFKSVEEIRNIEEISDPYFNKIKLYLTVD